jgi:hypothetical protein
MASAHSCLAQGADDFGDVVFLKQSDSCDAGGSGVEAGVCIGESYAAESKDWDACFAGFAKSSESCGL